MPNFRYKALTQAGEIVTGSIAAPTAAEVARRIEYLGLVPVDTVTEERAAGAAATFFTLTKRAKTEDVTVFTLDLSLLLKAGARLDDGLELLASDTDVGGLRPVVGKIRSSILSGESFGEALSHHPALFPPMYVALVRVGEASGTLGEILEVLAGERARAEALRRKLGDALRYPAFVLFAALSVLIFFLLFVLPQFAAVLRDFNAKLDPTVLMFIGISEFLRAHGEMLALALVALAALCVALARPHRSTLVASDDATVVLVIDVSGSMRAEDVKPTRLAAAQDAVRKFLDKVPSGVRVARVIGRARRGDEEWLYLDAGVFNGLLETIGGFGYELRTERAGPTRTWTVAGPSCDSVDTMQSGVELPELEVGERVYVMNAGAYTLSYASSFNGFGPPETHLLS